MARGGARQGTPGAAYANRSDLNADRQPVQAAKGQAYGERKAAEDAQRAIPLPGQFGPIDRPTEMPGEPVTAGLPFGAGPGPEILPAAQDDEDPKIALRALYHRFPNRDLLRLIAALDEGRV